jgi:1-pyrroline-5-carboxylate dehydrogenase
VAHPSADPEALVTALIRGAFEYQGQKCSAASRAYVPAGLWSQIEGMLVERTEALPVGDIRDFRNFMGAVISAKAFGNVSGYIERAHASADAEILAGGTYDDSIGWFIRPTVVRAHNPAHETLCEEIFGPVLAVHVYPDGAWRQTLDLVDRTSPYGLTGAVFARDRSAVREAAEVLRFAAGNFYVNDKPTGAVVGQQPFGGSRASGTNDKSGSALNLLRWVSPRSIKETLVPPTDHRYPFMDED